MLRFSHCISHCLPVARRVLAGVALLFFCQQALAHQLSATEQQQLLAAATLAQAQCYTLIYRDPNAYVLCLRELTQAEGPASYKRLGVEYFGFVGAAAYMRVSQIGAAQAAAAFVKSYRKTQKALGVSDAALCTSVPGNCSTRIAQSKQLEAEQPAPPKMHLQCIQQVCRLVAG